MTLNHLVQWISTGEAPPKADRLVVGSDGFFEKDELGNTKGGVRSVQLDVPHSTYHANPMKPDGTPSYLTVGNDQPFDSDTLWNLYSNKSEYLDRFDARVNELVADGWLLADDANAMRIEAEEVDF
jgi:hypothetical protein